MTFCSCKTNDSSIGNISFLIKEIRVSSKTAVSEESDKIFFYEKNYNFRTDTFNEVKKYQVPEKFNSNLLLISDHPNINDTSYRELLTGKNILIHDLYTYKFKYDLIPAGFKLAKSNESIVYFVKKENIFFYLSLIDSAKVYLNIYNSSNDHKEQLQIMDYKNECPNMYIQNDNDNVKNTKILIFYNYYFQNNYLIDVSVVKYSSDGFQ